MNVFIWNLCQCSILPITRTFRETVSPGYLTSTDFWGKVKLLWITASGHNTRKCKVYIDKSNKTKFFAATCSQIKENYLSADVQLDLLIVSTHIFSLFLLYCISSIFQEIPADGAGKKGPSTSELFYDNVLVKVQGGWKKSKKKARVAERLNYWELKLLGLYCITISVSMYHLNRSTDANYISQTIHGRGPY